MEHKDIYDALNAVQKELHNAKLDSKNPHFGNTYASLESYLDEARPVLVKHGLSITQGCVKTGDEWALCTRLTLSRESSIEWQMPLLLTKNDMQGLGSAVTYARRYAIAAMFGMGSSDDDAQGTSAQAANPVMSQPAAPVKNFAPRAVQSSTAASVTAPEYAEPNWQEYTKEKTNFNPADYVMPFGKEFKGKCLSQCDREKLKGFALWMKRQAEADKKPMNQKSVDTYCFIMAYYDQSKDQGPISEPPPMASDEIPF